MKVIAVSLFLSLTFSFCAPVGATTSNTSQNETETKQLDRDETSALEKLENRLLGTVYKNAPETTRVERLEKLVFGESSSGDLNARLGTLLKAVPSQKTDSGSNTSDLSATPDYDPDNNSGHPNASADGRGQTETDVNQQYQSSEDESGEDKEEPQYPRITALEQAILEKTYARANEPLEIRLARMETKVFGKPSTDKDLSTRTDDLQAFAEKEMKRPLFKEEANARSAEELEAGVPEEQPRPRRSRIPGIINAVSTALLGPVTSPYGPAMGPGPVGFGGVRIRHRQDVAAEEARRKGSKPESDEDKNVARELDPAILAKEPPPPGSKLLTRVAWCEQKLYGKVLEGEHLPRRLEKLNQSLGYKEGARGIYLMDHVDDLVKLTELKSN